MKQKFLLWMVMPLIYYIWISLYAWFKYETFNFKENIIETIFVFLFFRLFLWMEDQLRKKN